MEYVMPKAKEEIIQMNMKGLFSGNLPTHFWRGVDEIDAQAWHSAIDGSLQLHHAALQADNVEQLVYNTMGEGRFGINHWNPKAINRLYWMIKPVIPKGVIRSTRSVIHRIERKLAHEHWPIDDRLRSFLWDVLHQYLRISGNSQLRIRSFWPENKQFAFVLTHDIESPLGLAFVPQVAALDEKYGFRSLFNIVGDQIPKDRSLLNELQERGFEIGLHGWHHDSSAFLSREKYSAAAAVINRKLKELNAVGHRSPLNLRHPEWMQKLNIEYDLSFFDTDPFEPLSGGAMSIWPFQVGHFIELPGTLIQDNTLINLLGEDTPGLWLAKVAYLQRYHGMALLNSHPDYLKVKKVWNIYESFLAAMQENEHHWHALPKEVTRWWQSRMGLPGSEAFPDDSFETVTIKDEELLIR